jgi:hypothetical protein
MIVRDDTITLTLPRSSVGGILDLSAELTDRMHALLERNTDGELTTVEKQQLDTLVRMAHFGQIVSMALSAVMPPAGQA